MENFAYLPHTETDVDAMLSAIGVSSVADLFQDIPPELLVTGGADINEGVSEIEVVRIFDALAAKCSAGVSFLGGGCYDHLIPTTVDYITGRSEFATAYTPYQAEVSQGILQAIFEFQTMVTQLTGLPIPNASLYDGATAAAEACAMGIQSARGRKVVALSGTVDGRTRSVIETYFSHQGIDIVKVPEKNGVTSYQDLAEIVDEHVASVLVQSPNRYGIVENFSGFGDMLHDREICFVVSSNPLSLAILKSQADWGADIAVGDAQPLGLHQNFGGPSVGYIAAAKSLMRKMPGRIVGQSVDSKGKRAFVLTLQTREQHIKRARATSNICTNQALAALGVAVYLSTVGPSGLAAIAKQNVAKAHYLAEAIEANTRARLAFEQPFFNEFVLELPCDAHDVLASMLERGYLAGIPIGDIDATNNRRMLVAVTEKRTRVELDEYVKLIDRSIRLCSR